MAAPGAFEHLDGGRVALDRVVVLGCLLQLGGGEAVLVAEQRRLVVHGEAAVLDLEGGGDLVRLLLGAFLVVVTADAARGRRGRQRGGEEQANESRVDVLR